MAIERFIYNDLRREVTEPHAVIVVGPRQVGKTTLLRQLENECRDRGLRTLYLDLEQPGDLARLQGDREVAVETLTSKVDCVFIDEFYYLKNAGRIFKAIIDRRSDRPVKIFASGSSSVEIHSHLKESLAGRRLTYRVFPLTFDEHLQGGRPQMAQLHDYLRFGGMPGLSHTSDDQRKQRLLEEYVATYVFKDVRGLVREENIGVFNHLLKLLAQQQGQLVEVSRLARDLRTTSPTVQRYLDILDQTYVNFLVPSYHTNLANELRKSRKTYLYDLGVRNIILKDFRALDEREDRVLALVQM